MSFLRRRPTHESEPTTTVVTLPRSRRRGPAGDVAAERLRRKQAKVEVVDGRPHGWGRAEDPDSDDPGKLGLLGRRRANGTPLLLFTVLAVMTGVGLARVESRIEILDVANEITELSGDQQRLLDRKRRLETERAYLRRPARVSEQATTRLGMEPAPPDRIQRIELLPAALPEPELPAETDADPDAETQRPNP